MSVIFLSVILGVILTACGGEEPAEFIYEHLEEAVQIEHSVADKQGPLTEAEELEHEWYEEMLALSDEDEIQELSQQAIESAEERRTLMNDEKVIIEEAYEEFQQSKEFITELDEEVATHAVQLVQTMEERYELYEQLFNKYNETIELDIELYELIAQEDLTVEELQEQHDLVNEAYEEINELNNNFNEKTVQYNEEKREFYEVAELNVVYEDA